MSARPGRLVVVGDLSIRHSVAVDTFPAPGAVTTGSAYASSAAGRGLTQAVAAARQGADVLVIGAVGTDAAGGLLTGLLSEEGVDVRGVRRVVGTSGAMLVTTDATGSSSAVVAPGANAALRPEHVTSRLLARATLVLCQLGVPRAVVRAALERAKAAEAMTLLDLGALSGPLPAELLQLADLVVVAPTGRTGLAEVGESLVATGAGAAVVVSASYGAVVAGPGRATEVPAVALPVLDVTGADDAFVGGLGAALAAGEPVAGAARRAAAAAALAATRLGGVPSLPDRNAVDHLLAGRSDGRSRPRSPSATAPPGGPRRPPLRGGRAGGSGGPSR